MEYYVLCYLFGFVVALLVYYFRGFLYYKKESDKLLKVIDKFVKYGTKC